MGNSASNASILSSEELVQAVCKIECIHREPLFAAPWDETDSHKSQGSGFVVADPRDPENTRLVITNAHCIDFATQIRIQKHHSDVKAPAKVVRLNRDCDLAILAVEDPEFWYSDVGDTRFLCPVFSLGAMPVLQDSVRVVGYPNGGTEVCVTQGVVSRIQLQTYCHSGIDLLAVTTTAVINCGNSGGPVVDDQNRCVGIAFQGSFDLGEFIPTCVFERFLDVGPVQNDGEVVSVANIPFSWQLLKNKAMISSLKLDEMNETGIYVTRVGFGAVSEKLKVGDVIVEMEGIDIGNMGTFVLDSNRIGFGHLITSRAPGDVIQMGIVRDGERSNIELTLESEGTYDLVPEHDKETAVGGMPDFLVVGGIVFVALSGDSLRNIGNERREIIWRHMELHAVYPAKKNAEEEVVVVSKMLPNDVIEGYDDISASVVTTLNGKYINSLQDMAWEVESCTEDYLKIQFDAPVGECTPLVILDRKLMIQEEEALFKEYRIPFRSRINGIPDRSSKLASPADDIAPADSASKLGSIDSSSLISEQSGQ